MTLLFTDGFDTKDTTSKWVFSTSNLAGGTLLPLFTVTPRFSAGFAVSFAYDSIPATSVTRITRFITPSAHVYLGAAVKSGIQPVVQTYSVPFHVLCTDLGATSHLYLVTTVSGALQLWRGDARAPMTTTVFTPGGTMLATTAGGVIDANWHYVELGATIDSSIGTAVVKLDGATVLTFTGNTRNGGTSVNIDAVLFQAFSWIPTNSFVGSTVVDDLYICDGLGSVNNTFLGDIRVQTLLPTGAGSSTGLTPTGSGTNYLNCNEVPDNPATFNGAATPGLRDTYAMADLNATTAQVFAVQQVVDAVKSDSGAASIKPAQKSGATVAYGATRVLSTSMSMLLDVFELDPNTSAAYTVSGVNALEAGAEVV